MSAIEFRILIKSNDQSNVSGITRCLDISRHLETASKGQAPTMSRSHEPHEPTSHIFTENHDLEEVDYNEEDAVSGSNVHGWSSRV